MVYSMSALDRSALFPPVEILGVGQFHLCVCVWGVFHHRKLLASSSSLFPDGFDFGQETRGAIQDGVERIQFLFELFFPSERFATSLFRLGNCLQRGWRRDVARCNNLVLILINRDGGGVVCNSLLVHLWRKGKWEKEFKKMSLLRRLPYSVIFFSFCPAINSFCPR